MIDNYEHIINMVRDTLVKAGSAFTNEKKLAFESAIKKESNETAKWILEKMLENAVCAENNFNPTCDDTGIPHVVIEIGDNRMINGKMINAIKEGIREGLIKLPGRPMAINGNDNERLDQTGGLNNDSGAVLPAPFLIRKSADKDLLRLHILLFGGGPAIRAKTNRIFHKHNVNVVVDEIVEWAKEGVSMLGCSPCTLAIGVGRSHYEATALMLEAQIDGKYQEQNEMEREITKRLNEAKIGPLGLGGDMSVLATFMKIGPQRASGIRVVCVRPTCCVEPRIATVDL